MITFANDPQGREPWRTRDSFNAPSGTPLGEHEPDVGGPWQVHASSAIIEGGKLRRASGASGWVLATVDVGASSVSATAEINFDAANGVGIIFWYQDTGNFLVAHADIGSQRLSVLRYEGGSASILAQMDAPISHAAHRLRLEVAGRRMLFEVEGVVALAHDNLPVNAATTRCGIRMHGATWAVNEFRVRRGHLPSPPVAGTADNAPAPLVTPTYEGSGQVTHPSVVHAPDGWGSDANGKAWRYWMAMTPYPASNNSLENPSIIVSDDGDTWIEPPGLTNPIAGKPTGGYNSDTELHLADGVLHLLWRETDDAGTFDRLWGATSEDGINWSPHFVVLENVRNALLSPSLVRIHGRWLMYAVNRAVLGGLFHPHVVAYAADSLEGPWSERRVWGFPNPPHATARPWHLSVLKDGDALYMFLNDDQAKRAIWLGSSYDGYHWTFGEQPILQPSASGWDNGVLYRASGVRTPTGFDLWYAAQSSGGTWGIARTAVTLL